MGQTTFSGPVRSLAGFISGPDSVVPITTAVVALSAADYGGRQLFVNYAGVGGILTLPLIIPTGPDANIGLNYDIVFATTVNAGGYKIKAFTDVPGDVFIGQVQTTAGGGSPTTFVPNGTTNDVINLNGTTQGGALNSRLTIKAVAANKWLVTGLLIGVPAFITPFANA